MAHGIGDRFLGAAQQHVRAFRVFHRQWLLDVHVDEEFGHVFGQRAQCRAQVDRAAVAQLADGLAHVGQQQPRQGVGLLDVLLDPTVRQMAGHFQVQAERRQMMAKQVMQLAGNPRAFVDPCTLRKQGAGRAQFGIEAALLFPRFGLLQRNKAGDEHEPRNTRIEQRLHQRFEQREVQAQHEHGHHRELRGDQPDHAHLQWQQPWQHASGDHQQHAAKP